MRPFSLTARHAAGLAAVPLALALPAPALAQPLPLARRTGGVLIGDQALDRVFLARDLSGNGTARDPGEVTIFLDASNHSSLPSPTGNVFAIFAAINGDVFIAD